MVIFNHKYGFFLPVIEPIESIRNNTVVVSFKNTKIMR